MTSPASIINPSGDYEETVLRLAKHLGRDKTRRSVFNLIYGRGSKLRSKKQIAESLGKSEGAQIVQNALDSLAKHHLIERSENNGRVKDGSRWLYGKSEPVRALRDVILKYADNPSAAREVATKRQPSIKVSLSMVQPVINKVVNRKRPEKRSVRDVAIRIAVLMTNPNRAASIQTGLEAREILRSVFAEVKMGRVDVKLVPAPDLEALVDTLNQYKPDILHFSGHGGDQTLLFDNERAGEDGGTALNFEMIARVLDATSISPKLLVLVACNTVIGADRFLDHVPVVVAMADTIDDAAACEFSKRFYKSLVDGVSIEKAIAQTKLSMEAKQVEDYKFPTLICREENQAKTTLL